MKYKYFLPFLVVVILFFYFLYQVQESIKKDNLSNYRLYQNSLLENVSARFQNFLSSRVSGLIVVSSFDSVRRRDMEKIHEDITSYFRYVKELHVKAVIIYDENGRIIYSTNQNLIGLEHLYTDFFDRAKSKESLRKALIFSFIQMKMQKLFSPIKPSPSDLFIITPVFVEFDTKKIFSGAVAILVDLNNYFKKELFISKFQRYQDLMIFWEDGSVIYSHLHSEMVEKRASLKTCNNCHSCDPSFQEALKKDYGSLDFYKRKERYISNFYKINVENVYFRLFVFASYKRITGLVHRSIISTLLFTFTLIFAFFLSFYFFMRSRIQRIRAEEKIDKLRSQLALEEKLRKSEEKFLKFAEVTNVGIWHYKSRVPIPIDLPADEQIKMIFENGYLEYCNDGMAKMYGLENKEQLIGTPLKETLNPDDPRNIEFIRAFVEGGYNLPNYESYEKDIHGNIHVFLNSLAGVVTKDRKLVEAWGSQIDITEKKRMEEEKIKLENQLFQSQKMEAIGRLAGGIAHDFNNILTAIIGNAELTLSKMTPTSTDYKRIKSILDSAKRASDITRNLLTFSRKQLGEFVVGNLNDVVNSMAEILRRTIGEDINFVLSLSPDLKDVKMEIAQMEQVILNLIVNARDAMPEGGTLTISTRNAVKSKEVCSICSKVIEGEFAELSVSDTGIGIPPEIRDRIFEPFYSTKPDGSGLGLSIVYGALSQMKGHLTFTSTPGIGTTFYIYLPVFTEKSEKPRTVIFEGTEIKGGDERILIIEDEQDILEMMSAFLSNLGYEVIASSNAEYALEKIKEFPQIDFLITDVVLPGMKGPEIAKIIKEIYPQIKILFVSGYPEERITAQELWDRKVNFISKPFTLFTLAKKIREVLDAD